MQWKYEKYNDWVFYYTWDIESFCECEHICSSWIRADTIIKFFSSIGCLCIRNRKWNILTTKSKDKYDYIMTTYREDMELYKYTLNVIKGIIENKEVGRAKRFLYWLVEDREWEIDWIEELENYKLSKPDYF